MSDLTPNTKITMCSREIAELSDKRHDHVMVDCRKLAEFYSTTYSPGKSGELVKPSTYIDSTGRTCPCFKLAKQASLDLVTGYSLPHRHAINKRWMELEEQAAKAPFDIPQTLPDALRLAADLAEQKFIAEAKLAIAAPKAEALDIISTSDGLYTLQGAAKVLQLPPNKFCNWLRENRWTYKRAGAKNTYAYQDRISSGYLIHKTKSIQMEDGTDKVFEQVYVTPKGLAKLAKLLIDHEITIN